MSKLHILNFVVVTEYAYSMIYAQYLLLFQPISLKSYKYLLGPINYILLSTSQIVMFGFPVRGLWERPVRHDIIAIFNKDIEKSLNKVWIRYFRR